MTRIANHIRHNLIAYIALFLALGGTSYAVSEPPPNSVGGAQLKNHAIDPVKLDPTYTNGSVTGWAIVGPKGKVLAGGGRPRVFAPVIQANYVVHWGVKLKPNCSAVATIDSGLSESTEVIPLPNTNGSTAPFTAGYAVTFNASGRGGSATGVVTFNQNGQLTPLAFNVMVIC